MPERYEDAADYVRLAYDLTTRRWTYVPRRYDDPPEHAGVRQEWLPWTAVYSHPAENPYAYRQVEIIRRACDTPQRIDPRTLDPMLNVTGLYWRPVEDT